MRQRTLLVSLAAAVLLGGVSPTPSELPFQAEANEDQALIGLWELDLSRSSFRPGPAPTRETRTYTRDETGVLGRIERHHRDGHTEVIEYRADYDRDHLVSGSRSYDTLLLKRIDARTAEATLSHAGRVYGTARRVLSADGETMTIEFRRTEPGNVIHNVSVYRKVDR